MCKPFEIAKKVVDDFVAKKEPFSFEEVQDEILKQGGVFRIYVGMTLSDYLDNLEEKEIIYYGGESQKYYPRKKTVRTLEAYFAELQSH